MNLRDANNSGRLFKLPSWETWCKKLDMGQIAGYEAVLGVYLRTVDDEAVGLSIADVLSDAWEVQEPSVSITRKQLEAAIRKLRHDRLMDETTFGASSFAPDPIAYLAREFGLED